MVFAAFDNSSELAREITQRGYPQTASQVYSLGVRIYEMALENLKTIEYACLNEACAKLVKRFISQLDANKQELIKYYRFALNSEISLFYQNGGLHLSEAGEIKGNDGKVVCQLLYFYSCKLNELNAMTHTDLVDLSEQSDVLMLYSQITDNLYNTFRHLAHVYPIIELRDYFDEMAEAG